MLMLFPLAMPTAAVRPARLVASLAVVLFIVHLASTVRAVTVVTLPVEVVGEDGTTSSVSVDVPVGRARDVRSLWMQIHGLSYADIASVQVNTGAWHALNNNTVDVAAPGRSYGGIGGGFATLAITLALPAGAVVDGANTVRFRFNQTDGARDFSAIVTDIRNRSDQEGAE